MSKTANAVPKALNTEIIMITDRSGSMQSIRRDAEGGFNSFIAEQKKLEGECRVTSVVFNDRAYIEYEALPIAEAPQMSLYPSGMTSLYDTMHEVLTKQGQRIYKENWADIVIVTILTDGQDTSSRHHTPAEIREMIEFAQQHGWKFIFLAANQDAFKAGADLGIARGTTRAFAATAVGVTAAYADINAMTKSIRTHG